MRQGRAQWTPLFPLSLYLPGVPNRHLGRPWQSRPETGAQGPGSAAALGVQVGSSDDFGFVPQTHRSDCMAPTGSRVPRPHKPAPQGSALPSPGQFHSQAAHHTPGDVTGSGLDLGLGTH